jgi:hypothetical protein
MILITYIMNKVELKKLAIKKLNSTEIKNTKKQICQTFTFIDKKQQEECFTAFDKNFIKSFIRARQNEL